MIKISKRLQKIGDLALSRSSLNIMDVACDHALLSIYLYDKNNNLNIIASDINTEPLKKAKENIEKYDLQDKIELIQSDGIKLLNKNSTVVIAGLGKDTIIDILENDKDKLEYIDNLIISSHSKIDEVRKDIVKLGFKITKEEIAYDDNKYYIIILFTKGKENYSQKEYLMGPYLLAHKDDIFYEYYNYLINKYTIILNKMPNNPNKEELLNIINIIKEEL